MAEGRHSPTLTSKLLLSSSIIITIRFIVLVIYFPAGGKKIRKSKGKKKKKNTAQSPTKHRENKQSGSWHICPEVYTPNMEQLVVRECQGSRHKNPKHSAWTGCNRVTNIPGHRNVGDELKVEINFLNPCLGIWPSDQPPIWVFITFPVTQSFADRNSG